MNLPHLISQIKNHPDYSKAGMILCHNGVVRKTSRNGREVTGMKVIVNHGKLKEIIDANKKRNGIIEILVEINEDRELSVGEDVMYLVVVGDIRENVISALSGTLDEIKSSVTMKTEFYK